MFKRTLFVLFLIPLLILPSFVTASTPSTDSTAAMQTETAFTLAGLDGEVIVRYDSFGVPHIYATTTHDLLFAQGFVQAGNRWWQMEWSRHLGLGRLAEMAGADYAGQDSAFRVLGMPRNAQNDLDNASEEYLGYLDAFSAGVNAWLEGKAPEDLAVEYTYLSEAGLGVENVEPWEPLHTQVWLQVMSANLALGGLEDELFRQGLTDAGGALAARLLLPEYPYEDMPLIMEPGWEPTEISTGYTPDQVATPLLRDMRLVLSEYGNLTGIGSDNWVLSGAKTASGQPLLANDPHLGVQIPAIWFEVGLHCVELSDTCPYDVVGMAFPASPFVIVGHNQRIGWGVTNVGTDVVDLYTLEINPDNPNQYRFEGEWVDMDLITETVNVVGGEPIETTVQMTRFGPMVNELVGFEQPMAMRWSAMDASRTLLTFAYLGKASNWEDYQEGVAYFDIPAQNFVYADVDGNIGYIMSGRIPIRVEGHNGTLPVPGVDASFDWQGYVDPMENPRLYNPEVGYIVTANNAVLAPEDFPHVINLSWDFGYRAARIETLIQQTDEHTVETMAAIQNDNWNPAATFMVPVLAEIEFEDEALNNAAGWLTEWDYANNVDSAQAVLFNAFWQELMPLVFDELPFIPSGNSMEVLQLSNIIGSNHVLWRNEALGVTDRFEIMKVAFENAFTSMTEAYGEDYTQWRWGDVHQVFFIHEPIGDSAEAGEMDEETWALFNRRIPAGGSGTSPNAVGWSAANENFDARRGIPSMRVIMDFANFDNSWSVLPTGQSGDPSSPHYGDQMPLWAGGQYIPYLFTQAAVEADTAEVWTLRP